MLGTPGQRGAQGHRQLGTSEFLLARHPFVPSPVLALSWLFNFHYTFSEAGCTRVISGGPAPIPPIVKAGKNSRCDFWESRILPEGEKLSFSKARQWLRWGQTLVSSNAFQIGINQAATAPGAEWMHSETCFLMGGGFC